MNAATKFENVNIVAIVDPKYQTKEYTASLGLEHFDCLSEIFSKEKPAGVILATPTLMHVENGLECIKAGCPILVEKPISNS